MLWASFSDFPDAFDSWLPGFASNFSAEIAAGLSLFLFGIVAGRIRNALRLRAFRRFWGLDSHDEGFPFSIVTGVYSDPRPPANDRYTKTYSTGAATGLVGGVEVSSAAEARAAGYVAAEVGRYRSSPVTIDTDERLVRTWQGSWVCLGSDASNEKTQTILNWNTNQYARFDAGRITSIWDGQSYDIDQLNGRDRALVVKVTNPWSPRSVVIVCAGLGEPGTAGAAYYVAKQWRNLLRRFGTASFGLILEVVWNSDQTAVEIAASPEPRRLRERMRTVFGELAVVDRLTLVAGVIGVGAALLSLIAGLLSR